MVTPPRANKVDHQVSLHGVTRSDPYHWLRDDNWQRVMREPEVLKSEIRAHLDAGSTRWAQGGIAAALAADDSPDDHFADTMAAELDRKRGGGAAGGSTLPSPGTPGEG